MSSDEQGLLAAIVESPDDDVPRLVYADWLDEHGHGDRARLIRVQCQIKRLLATRDQDDHDRADAMMEDEELPLLYANEAAWHAALPAFDGLAWMCDSEAEIPDDWFDRGFFVGLTARNWPALARHGARAFAASPVRRLKIARLYAKGAAGLAEWPLLARVRELDLSEAKLTDTALTALSRSPYLGTLSRLKLKGNRIDLGVRALAKAPLGGLRSLDLSSNRIASASAVAALAASDWLADLEGLDLAANWDLRAAGLYFFLHDSRLPPSLNLGATSLTSVGARLLAECPAAERLHSLYFGWNDVDDGGVRALIDSPHLTNLTLLDLRGNDVSVRMRRAARKRFESTPGRHFSLFFDDPAASDPE